MIHFTEHAKERMAQRNIREEIITENLEMFYRYGFWNDRGDRLTLNTKSEIIHNMIKMKQHMLLIVKQKLQALKHKSLSETRTLWKVALKLQQWLYVMIVTIKGLCLQLCTRE